MFKRILHRTLIEFYKQNTIFELLDIRMNEGKIYKTLFDIPFYDMI